MVFDTQSGAVASIYKLGGTDSYMVSVGEERYVINLRFSLIITTAA